ncbi:hypothetical protein TPHA_0P01030 [Tetrapisispora phaffii CBS 4417]|uniref:NADH:flavin oxidoreductase/NADH oxidase N-terminal domain-containing protein n=1 Tax=Tetrapisispora phaffii (strain ATCC 24235 / CBS 4417 / NBRC 1672 / NRRL Y-8282 / UCD 70-5) TaxID=1071381 RepID=G8C283_TETPH|nr:hypothetical protein TPHA_0P01030 [Tetrapisispora phaffii CBS 4417]CCE66261.1 hypothetical protein TPHA_0P01030 [Tetrapisispora phaffii CBS 4417]
MSFVKNNSNAFLKESNLFKPITVGDITLGQRISMSPLTRMRADPSNHVPKEIVTTYYKQRAERKGTLIISEATFISEAATGYDHAPGIYSKEQIEAWKKIIKAVHDEGSFFFSQLWSLGWQASPESIAKHGLQYLAPSESPFMDETQEKACKDNNVKQHAMTKEEIKSMVADYVQAAKNAIEAGADGVEIHAANGYLPNQFLDPLSNRRTDEYGGSIENRCRFVLEIVDGVIEAVGASKVGIRLSPYGTYGSMTGSADPTLLATYAFVVGELEKRAKSGKRMAYIHAIEPEKSDIEAGKSLNFIFSIWEGVVIRAANMIQNFEKTKEFVDNNDRTIISYGSFFIANPDLIDRLEKGLPFNKPDVSLFFTREKEGYIDYPVYADAVKLGYKLEE